MTTIITSRAGSGAARRCDATCHNAKAKDCSCICGGRYHGKGSSEAAQELLTEDFLGSRWREDKERIEAAGGSYVMVIEQALFRKGEPVTQQVTVTAKEQA